MSDRYQVVAWNIGHHFQVVDTLSNLYELTHCAEREDAERLVTLLNEAETLRVEARRALETLNFAVAEHVWEPTLRACIESAAATLSAALDGES